MRARELVYFWYLKWFKGFSLPGRPWLDDAALVRFKHLLGSANLYLEFGAGGSTILADSLGIETVTVETDRMYASVVRSALPSQSSVSIRVVNIGITGPKGYPLFRRPTAARLDRWRRYVLEPFDFLGGRLPDFILIDGRFRLACALASIHQAAQSGLDTRMMVDDYGKPGREGYTEIETYLGQPERVGRAALFSLQAGNVLRVPSKARIDLALRDPQ